jgi:16S rRNA (guanine527-N7)-methyltransferase
VTDLPRWFSTTPLPGIRRPPTSAEVDQFGKYLNILTKWQNRHRLVGSIEPAWVVENIILDSLCFLEATPADMVRVADLGSGAGIPGIPLAIVRRDLDLTLIEARQRRASFLSTVVRELTLNHVTVVASRAEDAGADLRERFDVVVMRCAGSAERTLAPAFALLRSGGTVVAAAGPASAPVGQGEDVAVQAPSGTWRTFHRYVKP